VAIARPKYVENMDFGGRGLDSRYVPSTSQGEQIIRRSPMAEVTSVRVKKQKGLTEKISEIISEYFEISVGSAFDIAVRIRDAIEEDRCAATHRRD
jgi:hypothetical protein